MKRTLPEGSAFAVVVPRRDLCLDFVNTVSWRGSEPADSLAGVADLLRWCNANGVIDDASRDRLDRWATRNPVDSTATFEQAIALRENLYRMLFALARDEAASEDDVVTLNATLGREPARRTLVPLARGYGWLIEGDRRATPSLLAPVLWSTADLLVGSAIARLRHCANPKCLWLFLDDSKNGSRRWCAMQACGNRAKAHRHYLRRRMLGTGAD